MLELIPASEITTRRRYDKEILRDREQLIKKLQEWVNENGRIPKEFDLLHNPKYPSYVTYAKVFGSWDNALITAGIGIRQAKKKYTTKQLIEILQKWGKDNDKIPAIKDFDKNKNLPSFQTYTNEFGSWGNALTEAGFKPNDVKTRSRHGEVQTISEFKTVGAIDLSGENRTNTCDGICPKGEMFDTKSASLTNMHGRWGWKFYVSINQLEEADYLFLRAYKDKDFTKPPVHKWRVPIDFMNGRTNIIICKNKARKKHYCILYDVEDMMKYEI